MSFITRLIAGGALAASVLVVTGAGAAGLPSNWKNWSHFREVDAGEDGGLWSVSVPDDLWKHGRTDLVDLRLIDADGGEVGYVLFTPGTNGATRWRPGETIDRGVVPGEYSQLVVDTGSDGDVHNAVEVTLTAGETEVFTWTEVAASSDRETWRIVRPRAPLYRFEDRGMGGPVTIRYPRTRDRWIRLRLLEEGADFEISSVRVGERPDSKVQYRRVTGVLARRVGDPEVSSSIWESQGSLPAMPIAGVRVETERDEFYRPVVVSTSENGSTWTDRERGVVYRFDGDASEGSPRQEQLELTFREIAAAHWQVRILDRGDPAIEDLRVILLRKETKVVFRTNETGPLRLVYGNHLAEAPEYELVQLASEEALSGATEAILGREQTNESYRSPDPFTERHPVVMWAALVLAVLVVGGLAIKSLR